MRRKKQQEETARLMAEAEQANQKAQAVQRFFDGLYVCVYHSYLCGVYAAYLLG